MWFVRKNIKYDEIGLVFKNGRFVKAVEEGAHWFFSRGSLRVEVEDQRGPWIRSASIDQIRESELVNAKAEFVDLKDGQRALIWIDGRLDAILGPGLYGLWNQRRKVEVELTDASSELKLVRKDLLNVLKNAASSRFLDVTEIPEGKVGVLFVDGAFSELLPSGKHAFWKDVAKIKIHIVDQREQVLDVLGQDIMTNDKVTLRLNAILAYRIVDARKSIESTQDAGQALYRETQLALRSEVGSRNLDTLLSDKEGLAPEAKQYVAKLAEGFGIEVVSLGVRDIILPGDMKDLMNKVIEAQKASEANVIKRREETAAMRSQLNTAKLMESNPVLMRLRELEVLESVSKTSNLSVVLGEKGLAESVTKLI
ncbi:MAG: slipin family protein [Verrucomicrobiota bacterium]